jgi:hypothetical protein
LEDMFCVYVWVCFEMKSVVCVDVRCFLGFAVWRSGYGVGFELCDIRGWLSSEVNFAFMDDGEVA